MSVAAVAYAEVLGLPVVVWGGMATLLMVSLTFAIGFLNHRGIRVIPLKYHKPCAIAALAMSFIHGALALLSNLGF